MSYYNLPPEEAADRYLADEADYESRLPICDNCGEPIQSDYWWECEPGEKFCEYCFENWAKEHRHSVEIE